MALRFPKVQESLEYGVKALGFDHVRVFIEPRSPFTMAITFYENHPAAEHYVQNIVPDRFSDSIMVEHFRLKNARRYFVFNADVQMLMEIESGYSAMREYQIVAQILDVFTREWLKTLDQVEIESLSRKPIHLVAIQNEPEPSRLARFVAWLNKITTPPVVSTEDHPKGIYPKTGKWVE